MSRFDSRFYPPSKPRTVEGGLRARSSRGKIAGTWWSTRFIEVLESTGMGNRLTRGKNYARRGQVLSLDLNAGQVTASVQGSRSRPYRVRIGVTAYGKDQWSRIEERLSADAWFVAQLLAGEMPPDIEQVFSELGLALFPSRAGDLALDCSCPDWEVPCKHLAAVFYLLAERFDDDPFEILAWRGRDRDDLLARLDAAAPGTAGDGPAVPLTDLLEVFYLPAAPLTSQQSAGQGSAGPSASLLEQLPAVDLTVRGRSLTEALAAAYQQLAAPQP